MSNKSITIFGANVSKEIESAIKALTTGFTPRTEIRTRTIRGGQEAKYVNTYYMTRQASLLTGWRWSSRCLREKLWPDEAKVQEIGVLMEVVLYDQDGNAFSHQSWGSAEVKRYAKDQYKDKTKVHNAGDVICIFDDYKSAYSDGIKKCLSYVGIANDIYGGKDMSAEFFDDGSTENIGNGVIQFNTVEARTVFDQYVKANKVRYDIVLRLLNAQSLNDVSDWQAAYNTIKNWIEGGRQQQ